MKAPVEGFSLVTVTCNLGAHDQILRLILSEFEQINSIPPEMIKKTIFPVDFRKNRNILICPNLCFLTEKVTLYREDFLVILFALYCTILTIMNLSIQDKK